MECRVIQQDSLDDAESAWVGPGWAAARTSQAPTKHTGNEDALLWCRLSKGQAVLAVADGLGGHAGGAKAAKLAIQTLKKFLEKKFKEERIREILLQGIEAANKAVLRWGIGAATTLSSVIIDGKQIQSFHAGDSLTLLVSQKGVIKFQTIPHSPVGYAVESGMLDAKEAMSHADRHLVSNILGSKQMRIEMGPRVGMTSQDTLLICSDGVYDNLHIEEIVEIIRKGGLKTAANQLLRETRKRMENPQAHQPSKPDDYSFLLFRRKK